MLEGCDQSVNDVCQESNRLSVQEACRFEPTVWTGPACDSGETGHDGGEAGDQALS